MGCFKRRKRVAQGAVLSERLWHRRRLRTIFMVPFGARACVFRYA